MTTVMRPTQKAETRQRIIDAAAGLFRVRGIDAVGVDAVMRAAGLTHGGFYAHFPSKEALVAEVCATSLARAAARWERISRGEGDRAGPGAAWGANQEAGPGTRPGAGPATGGAAALAAIVEAYLDPAHVAAVERGCVLATLGPEVARRPQGRSALTDSLGRMVDVLGRCLPEDAPAPLRRERALAALSTMVGAVVLARLSSDERLAAAFLAAARSAVLSDFVSNPQDGPAGAGHPDGGESAG